ncbi:hypothetical protein MRX96_020835 [Rhipicephalus microplus]
MFAQVLLYALGLLSPVTLEWVVLPQAGEKEGPPSFCGLSLDVLYAAPPCLDTSLPFIRQHGTASDNPAVDNSAHFDGSLGHGAAFSAQHSLTMFAQPCQSVLITQGISLRVYLGGRNPHFLEVPPYGVSGLYFEDLFLHELKTTFFFRH